MGTTSDTIGPDGTSTLTSPRRIGLMGGSFDPVHMGHLLAAEQCREQLRLDELRFIPAAVSPFKLHQLASDAKHRLEMLQLATGGNPYFRVDDRELRRGGTSFTVDTLRELKAELPGEQLVFLMGADALADFDKWREPPEICRLAQVVVVARGGQPLPNMAQLANYLSPEADLSQHLIAMPQCELSSSAIRAAVAAGRSIRYQVPAAVEAYLKQHKLYL
ncbi:MAG: nicotinate (nicotinamide) nucleotide adenylyltransferase [Pirellulaceae bacterium]|nr:nicotinate (nicotinamide) nucleotide adenylyltransferase [Pirellulaceae bacterium]